MRTIPGCLAEQVPVRGPRLAGRFVRARSGVTVGQLPESRAAAEGVQGLVGLDDALPEARRLGVRLLGKGSGQQLQGALLSVLAGESARPARARGTLLECDGLGVNAGDVVIEARRGGAEAQCLLAIREGQANLTQQDPAVTSAGVSVPLRGR